MTINVTRQHIENGLIGECDKCPVALALLDVGCLMVTVGDYDTCFYYNGQDYQIVNPPDVQEFVANFDDEAPVEPFSFTLDL